MTEKITDEQREAIQGRVDKWHELRDWYAKAEQLKEEGQEEVTIPIEVFLYAKEVPKNVESFWRQTITMLRHAGEITA